MSSKKMQYKNLGHSGLKVSELCLGAMNFGWTAVGGTTEHDAFKILDRFAELGGNFIDTADAYESGESERIIGKWLQKQKRQQFIIATKAYFPMGSGPNDAGLSRKHLFEAVEGSLQRLQTTYIDLYQLHNWDKEVPIEETLVALNDLVRSGKVRYIGVSNFRGYQLIIASEICNKLNLAKFICLQPQYNLLCREPEWEILASAQHLGLGIIPWSPLRGGWLSGKWTRKSKKPEGSTEGRLAWQEKSKFPDNSWEVNANEQTWSIIDTLESIAKKHSKSVSQVAIRWVMQRPGVTAPIVGPRNLTQAEDNFGVVGWELTKEEMDELNNVSTPKVPYPYNFF